MDKQKLKEEVKFYWNQASCGTEFIDKPKFSRDYFEAIEEYRYMREPEIFAFAQFTRFHKQKVLEVGIGAGSDFIQWVRAGAIAYGIDLTPEAIENVQQRLQLYDLKAQELLVADAEQLPYPDNFFDIVYSWGVIHHSPDTRQCLSEIVRVTRPGGTIKIMIYNRNSLFAFYRYLAHGLMKARPFRSRKSILFRHQESPGTKAYTFDEARELFAQFPVSITSIAAPATQHDLLTYKTWPFRLAAYILASIFGWHRVGWFMVIEAKKE
jgi:SAM-dependent methyltransferase